jgi:hypothetical protein
MKRTTCWGMALLILCGGLAQAADPWDAPDYQRRLALTVPAAPGGAARCGFVLAGRDFFRWTGFPRPGVKALMLGGPAGRLALQVEERDGTGRLVAEGNGRLDDDDQILFAVDLGPQTQRLHLYYDGPDAPDLDLPTTVAVKPGNPLEVKSGELSLFIRGGGLDDSSVNNIANHGRGSIVQCTWGGVTVANQNSSWGDYFPAGVAASPNACKWSEPTVVANGPVRTVIEVHCDGFQAKQGEKVTLQANVTNYLAVWNGVPCVDFDQVVDYTATDYEGGWGYSGGACIGKDMDANDRLIVPLLDKAYEVKFPSREAIQAAPYQQLYDTWVPDEGWFGWMDTIEKTGMATFYETLPEIRERDEWVAYRPAWNPAIYLRTTPYRPEVRLSFIDRALRARSRWQRALRYVFLHNEKPDDIRLLYRCWGAPLEESGKVEAPETQK